MKIVVRVGLIPDWGEVVGRIDRPSQTLEPEAVGLTLEDGKRLLHSLQQAVIRAQAEEIHELSRICRGCHRRTSIKDYRRPKQSRVFRTLCDGAKLRRLATTPGGAGLIPAGVRFGARSFTPPLLPNKATGRLRASTPGLTTWWFDFLQAERLSNTEVSAEREAESRQHNHQPGPCTTSVISGGGAQLVTSSVLRHLTQISDGRPDRSV
jgi:hypothetical protein